MSLLEDLKKKIGIGGEKQPTLASLIRKQTGASPRNIFVQDRFIDLILDEDMVKFLSLDRTDQIKWIPELQDCDDISRIFWNAAKIYFFNTKRINASVGWIWAGSHALNFYVNTNLKCIFIEPQTDLYVPLLHIPSLVVI